MGADVLGELIQKIAAIPTPAHQPEKGEGTAPGTEAPAEDTNPSKGDKLKAAIVPSMEEKPEVGPESDDSQKMLLI